MQEGKLLRASFQRATPSVHTRPCEPRPGFSSLSPSVRWVKLGDKLLPNVRIRTHKGLGPA